MNENNSLFYFERNTMKPVLFSLIALFCTAPGNVIIQLRFSKYHSLTLMTCYISVILAITLGALRTTKTSDPSFCFPRGADLFAVVILGVIFFAADYFFVGAYTHGGTLFLVTSIIVLFPITASLIKYCFTRDYPNGYQLCGYLFGIIGVILVICGDKK